MVRMVVEMGGRSANFGNCDFIPPQASSEPKFDGSDCTYIRGDPGAVDVALGGVPLSGLRTGEPSI